MRLYVFIVVCQFNAANLLLFMCISAGLVLWFSNFTKLHHFPHFFIRKAFYSMFLLTLGLNFVARFMESRASKHSLIETFLKKTDIHNSVFHTLN